jgi:hypothetical protein
MRYNQGRRILGGLDSANPQLSITSIGPYIPSRWDINGIHDQIGGLKPGTTIEDHHNFPIQKQLESYFRRAGIDPENYKMFVEKDEHRLRPNGLHTLRHNWNARWLKYMKEHSDPKPKELLEQLSRMMKDVPWLKI